jgi:RND family efflux transporter MFP subunit
MDENNQMNEPEPDESVFLYNTRTGIGRQGLPPQEPDELGQYLGPPVKRRGTNWAGIAVAATVVAALIAIGMAPRIRQAKKLDKVQQAAKSDAMDVNVEHLRRADSTTNLTLPSNVQAIEETNISARTAGYVHAYFVDIGSRVKRGQVLALIESPEIDQQLMAARAESARSVASGQQAVADVSKLRANVAQTRADVVRFQADVESARADLAHAQAKLLAAEGAVSQAKAVYAQAQKNVNGKRADLARAKTRLTLADKTYTRWKELARGGAVSGQDLDESEANFESSQSTVDSAQADVESSESEMAAAQAAVSARNSDVEAAKADISSYRQKVSAAEAAVDSSKANVSAAQAAVLAGRASVNAATATIHAGQANENRYTTMRSFEKVTAPFDGIITARNVDQGSLIDAGSASNGGAFDPTSTVPHTGLFGIARTDWLRIQVSVPQSYLASIKQGQSAEVDIQELPGRVFHGTVFDSAGALDASSRTMLVEVRLRNTGNELIPGMYAKVKFMLAHKHGVLMAPANTLIIDGQGTRVAIVGSNQRVTFQQVKLGRDFGKEVQVLTGLTGDERLVADPSDALEEGAKVHVVAEAK